MTARAQAQNKKRQTQVMLRLLFWCVMLRPAQCSRSTPPYLS
jgi:hypothetical protein